ncbi:hypothetical protein, partial [Micromonospora sp. CB01531]|uniref:hypothetical protein n=1 Tax=Micromonospora sp. CB01531 TaxID=1718947 RepID=UPI0018E95EC8
MPGPDEDWTQWTWEQGLQSILRIGRESGQTPAINRALVAGPGASWLQFVKSEIYESGFPVSFDHPPPNEIILWNNYDSSNILVVRGKISLYDKAGDGPSPHDQFMRFQYVGDEARTFLSNPPADGPWQPQSFVDAASVVEGVIRWLDSSNTQLNALVRSINHDNSGFSGSAAGAFAAVLDNLQNGVEQLHTDIAGPGETNWADRIRGKAGDMKNFSVALIDAWNQYQSQVAYNSNFYNPGHLVEAVRGILNGGYSGNLNSVSLSFGDGGGGTFDLTTSAGWQQVNERVKNAWLLQVGNLDSKMREALTHMVGLFRDTQRHINMFGTPPQNTPGGVGPNGPGGGGGGPNPGGVGPGGVGPGGVGPGGVGPGGVGPGGVGPGGVGPGGVGPGGVGPGGVGPGGVGP